MRRSAVLIAVLAVLTGSACFSHVPHGPRVEPGTRWHITASAARTADFQDENARLIPSLFAGGGHGWVAQNGAAVSLGAQVPVLLLPYAAFGDRSFEVFTHLLTADLYVQPRRAAEGGIDFGVGAMAGRGMAMPYVQAGKARDGGIFTTQGVAFTFGEFNRVTYWAPSVSLRSARPDASRAVDYYLGGIVGWYDRPGPSLSTERQTEWVITLGVVAELRRRD